MQRERNPSLNPIAFRDQMNISTHSGNFSPRRLKHHALDAGLPVKTLTAPDRDDPFYRGLWERANLIRSFVWNQDAVDETALLRQVLNRIRDTFSIDVCF
jgi:hypothetical protein